MTPRPALLPTCPGCRSIWAYPTNLTHSIHVMRMLESESSLCSAQPLPFQPPNGSMVDFRSSGSLKDPYRPRHVILACRMYRQHDTAYPVSVRTMAYTSMNTFRTSLLSNLSSRSKSSKNGNTTSFRG